MSKVDKKTKKYRKVYHYARKMLLLKFVFVVYSINDE